MVFRASVGIGLTIFRALERPILFFGGKGGVGKTTLAAATALESARRGARTLLVSTDSAHSTSDILGVTVDAQPGPVEGDLWAAEIDPASAVEDYIRDVKGRIADVTPPRLVAEVERQIDAARVSPGAEEAALFDRFTRLLGDERFDRIVFDTAPTGQTLRLLSLPELMTNWIGGLIAQRRKVSSLGRMWRNVAGAASGSEREIGDPVLAALEERRDRF
ncbi:MAG: TRC40/GET3/ArsA family transport-energizing ATPase, partial [Gemmatimonadetes bacterium]|nr:TRC40/GET3/ArsA family transport-energizing ATPase [Gemmatimonadota bacterium]